jgi:Flp pilus assembly protein TadG
MGAVMKFRLASKLVDITGQSFVELALVLPLLLLLALGVFDLSRAIQANNIISNMSREGANLASRATFPPQQIMSSLASTAQPLAMGTKGAMYMTKVTGGVGRVPTVQSPQSAWGNTTGGLNSRIDLTNVAPSLKTITMAEGDTLYIFEVMYTYTSLFFPSYSYTLYSITIL